MDYNIKLTFAKDRAMRSRAQETTPRIEDDPSAAVTSNRPTTEVGPLGRMVGYALRRAQLAVFDSVIKNFAVVDLRPGQYSVLVMLKSFPGLKQSEVAAALGIQRANFVVLFDGLERRGLAERRPSANDRRSYALYLTESGKDVLARADAIEAEYEAHLDSILGSGGREQLLALLDRLTQRA